MQSSACMGFCNSLSNYCAAPTRGWKTQPPSKFQECKMVCIFSGGNWDRRKIPIENGLIDDAYTHVQAQTEAKEVMQ